MFAQTISASADSPQGDRRQGQIHDVNTLG
jgi:hypothetical protein